MFSEARRSVWRIPRTGLPLLHALAGLAIVGFLVFSIYARPDASPSGDAIRYIPIGLNLADHGVFSTNSYSADEAPEPTLLQGGPLIGVELAAALSIDAATRDVFECTQSNDKDLETCRGALLGLKTVRLVELLIALGLFWLISRQVLGSAPAATCAVAIAAIMRETTEYADMAITEPLYFMLFMLFAWFLLRLADVPESRWTALGAGLALGLTTLIKPVAAPLLLLVPLLLLADGWLSVQRVQPRLLTSCAFIAGGAALIVPWMLRNWSIVGAFGLADPAYLEAALAHRVAYNAMTGTEWAVGWIYYLPDFGDQLASALFPADMWTRLGWGDDGFYVYGRDTLISEVHEIGGDGSGVGYIMVHYILAAPLTHAGVSLLLLWRGLFVSSYLGLIAILTLPAMLWAIVPEQRRLIAYLALPAFAIAGLNAGLSVSIPRYNVALIPLYAITLTWVLAWIIGRFPGGPVRPRGDKRNSPG